MVNVPKTRRTFCAAAKCRKHTLHKVTQYKKGEARSQRRPQRNPTLRTDRRTDWYRPTHPRRRLIAVGLYVSGQIERISFKPLNSIQARTRWPLRASGVTTASKKGMVARPNPSSERRLKPPRRSCLGKRSRLIRIGRTLSKRLYHAPVIFRLECTDCKRKDQVTIKRCKHFELGGEKKKKGQMLQF